MNEGLGIAKQLFGESLGQQGFADAGGAEQGKGPDRPPRIFEIGPRPTQGLAEGGDSLALADNDLVHLGFDLHEALHFALFHPLQGNAGPFGDDVQNIFLVHLYAFFFACGTPFLQNGFEFFLGLFFLVAHGGGALEILLSDRVLFLGFDVLDIGFKGFDLRRSGHSADAGARAGLVHQVDGFVRKVTIGDISI